MNTLMNKQQGDVITILTHSWRYFATGSVLALFCQFALYFYSNYPKYILFINIIIFIVCQYYIYRLWLDNHFFKIIYTHNETEHFDNALNSLFPNKIKHRTMQQRWSGTKRLFTHALGLVLVQWIGLLVTIIAS